MKLYPQLTQLNIFKYGYDHCPFILRRNDLQNFWVSYDGCNRIPLDFKSECLNTAELINSQTQKKIWLFFSGGIDSEVMVRSFFESKVRFNTAIIKFENDLNKHDISWAINTCNELGISYELIPLNINWFWQTQGAYYSQKSQSISPQLLISMWLSDQVDGYAVIGSGECLLNKEDDGEWYLYEKERIAALYRFFLETNRPACPGFFQYTPEIMLSYLEDPLIKSLVNNEIPNVMSSADIKFDFYSQHFRLKNRPKYTGFENLQNEDYFYRSKFRKLHPHSDQIVKTKYSKLINDLRLN